ncbi:hypothetical protein VT84_09715 [Gemmata sp. SH-PL17]|uniref:hypothetical protein n=1 Tax=Gemmata sp. SH-PL17 TaxID=1630693 RepID=UPI0004B90E5D|nr:hypothetical protein [Gemmata sp. SH-PL17]AMV24660.1 hypothetical protein VT84_09715 [Gemmata sp. SH-PL17]
MSLVESTTGPRVGNREVRCAACEYGPLATTRKRVAVACRCAGYALGLYTDHRIRKMLDVGRAYTNRFVPLAALVAALREAEAGATEAGRRAVSDVWSIFEGLRAGDAREASRASHTAVGAVQWALGMGGAVPPVPPKWVWAQTAIARSATAPVFAPEWRTHDVQALARLAQIGDLGALPILADALQDAGCEDEQILSHCRDPHEDPHTPGCWVPDLILDVE